MRQWENTGAYALLWSSRDIFKRISHLSKLTRFYYYTPLWHLACYYFRTIMNESRRRPLYFQSRSNEYVTENTRAMGDLCTFFSQHKGSVNSRRGAMRRDTEGTRRTRGDCDLFDRHRSVQSGCNMCEKCRWRRLATKEQAPRIRTWHGATRLAAREELAKRAPTRTHPTAPFQPTRPTDRPTDRNAVEEQVPTLSLSLFHPRRRNHHPPTISADLSERASLFTPGFIPGPNRRCRGLVEHALAPVERFIYTRLSPASVPASSFIAYSSRRIKRCKEFSNYSNYI